MAFCFANIVFIFFIYFVTALKKEWTTFNESLATNPPQCPARRESIFIIVAASLGAVIVIQLFIIFTCAVTRRKSESPKMT